MKRLYYIGMMGIMMVVGLMLAQCTDADGYVNVGHVAYQQENDDNGVLPETGDDTESEADAGQDSSNPADTADSVPQDTAEQPDNTPDPVDDTSLSTDMTDENICEIVNVSASPLPPRVMILQDLSSSLDTGEGGRWDTLKAAMVQMVDTYDSQFALGLVPFATTVLDGSWNDGDCTVNREHVLLPTVNNGVAIKDKVYNLDTKELVGGTPTYEGLMAAREVLVDQDPGDGSQRVAILVTDGLPNCLDGNGGGASSPEDQERVTATIEQLHNEDNIDIYVVAYDLWSSYADLMNSWAELGGTSEYYPAEDTTGLLEQMQTIATELVPCEYVLESPVADPEFVRVQIDEVSRPYNKEGGWLLGEDNRTVTLVDESCNDLRAAGDHDLTITVECEKVIIFVE